MADLDFRSENGLVVNNNLIFAMGNSGRVGICTNAPQANLDVNGTCNIFGNTFIGQNVTIGGITEIRAATSILAPFTTTSYGIIGGQLDVRGNENVSGVLTVTGDINAGEDLAVTRNLSVGGSFTIQGPVIFNNTLNVGSDLTVGGKLTVSGFTLIDDSSQINGHLQVNGGADITGITNIGQNLSVGGTAVIQSTLRVNNATTLTSVYGTGTAQFTSLGIGTAPGGGGEIRATNDITAFFASDERLKENMIPIAGAKEKLLSLTGYEFDWTDEYMDSRGGEDGYFVYKHDIGVSAQQVERVAPELVRTRPNGTKAVKYAQLTALLIEGYKDQQREIDELKKKLGV